MRKLILFIFLFIMTTVEVRTLTTTARKPTLVPSRVGYFQLYASQDYDIKSKSSRSIDTGLQIKIPDGYDIDIIDDKLSISRGLWINRYPGIGESTPFIEGEIPRLSYIVYNSSAVDVTIHAGDAFGWFRFLKIGTSMTLTEVQNFGVKDEPSMPIVDIPKTAAGYFKRMSRTNRTQCVDLFLDNNDGTEVLKNLEEYRKTNAYINAADQAIAEAYWLWDNITPDIRDHVKTVYKKHKDDMIIQSRYSS